CGRCLSDIPKIERGRMSEVTYRAAVIGLGVMGQIADGLGGRHPDWFRPCCHADAYEDHPRTQLIAGSTRDSQRQERFRSARQLPVYSDYREMLEKERPDVVSIATPATVHAEMVIAAAEAGAKAVWCEKAMAVSLAQCDQMVTACEASGTVLAINHQRRWDDRYVKLKEALDSGVIGQLQAIALHFGNGRLCRGGSHAFDLALMFTGEEVAWGMGWLSNPDDFDPGGTGVFETKSGVRITVDGAIGMHHGLCWECIGDAGILKGIDDGFHIQLWTPDERSEASEFGNMSQRYLPRSYPVRNTFLNVVDDLVCCLETGAGSQSSGIDGRFAFEMISASHLSHQKNKKAIEFPIVERDLDIPSN
ncbi:MAG: Gfo/Idh/MocA family oxidoreductase, partial [bacterium]|nr:Gfo/Idh/MocA family oxidoreductase [bacterium]